MAESSMERSLVKNIVTALLTSVAAALLAFLLASKGMEVEVEANKRDLLDMAVRLRAAETMIATLTARADGSDKKIDDIWQVVVNGRQASFPPFRR